MGCEIKCGRATESTYILYIGVWVTRTVKFSIKETFKIYIFSVFEGSTYNT